MSEFPTPASVHERALSVAGDGPAVLVGPALDTDLESPDVDVDGDCYVGPDAAAVGLLAAALDAGVGRLDYPDPSLAADGPWLVLSPCGGRLRTVDCGTATVRIEFDAPAAGSHARLTDQRKRLDSVLSAARPTHDHYPVELDDDGIFTTGMTTFSLESASADSVRLRATTTPSTTAEEIRDRFVDSPDVTRIVIERTVGVERAAPDAALRSAVEDAHVSVVGDCEYAWSSTPTALSTLPSANKIAFGAGTTERFDAEAVADTATILSKTVAAYGGGRE